MRYYIDTCVWIDYLEERTGTDIFVECMRNQDTIVVSDTVLRELMNHVKLEHIRMAFAVLKAYHIMENIDITIEHKLEAEKIAEFKQIPFGDALHAILARESDATLLTRDKHFLKLFDTCRIKLL